MTTATQIKPDSDELVRNVEQSFQEIDDESMPSAEQYQQVHESVADLTVARLRDRNSAVSKAIAALADRERQQPPTAQDAPSGGITGSGAPIHAYSIDLLVPRPNSSSLAVRTVAPTAAILLNVLRCSAESRAMLADRLHCTKEHLADLVERAAERIDREMGPARFVLTLRRAANRLLMDGEVQVQLIGGQLTVDGVTVDLSPQQACFVGLLLQHCGEAVHVDAFKTKGLHHTAKLKERLLTKLRASKIELDIVAMPKAYRLMDARLSR